MSDRTEKLVLAGVHVPTIEEVLAMGQDDVVKVKSFYWNCPLCKEQMFGHSLVEKRLIKLAAEAGQPLFEQHEHEGFASAIKGEIEAHLEGHESEEVSSVG